MRSKKEMVEEFEVLAASMTRQEVQRVVDLAKEEYVMPRVENSNEALSNYLGQLSRNARACAIDIIMEACGVVRGTVYNWVHGCNPISIKNQRAIEDALQRKIFSLPSEDENV